MYVESLYYSEELKSGEFGIREYYFFDGDFHKGCLLFARFETEKAADFYIKNYL